MKIAIGFATLLGTIGSGVALIIPLIAELMDATAPLGVSPNVWVIVSAGLAGLVVLGRMGQAIAGFLKQPPLQVLMAITALALILALVI